MKIAFCGVRGSGKTTAAELTRLFLVENDLPCRVDSFARPLKEACVKMYDYLPPKVFFGTKKEKEADLAEYGLAGVSGRSILETVGTRGFIAVTPSVFARRLIDNIVEGESVVVDDMRNNVEAEEWRASGGLVIRLTRDIDGTRLFSERDVDDIRWDAIINNEALDVAEFKMSVEALLRTYLCPE